MAEDKLLPQFPELPSPPQDEEQLLTWARTLNLSIMKMYVGLMLRMESMIMHGATADRPDADGSRRFYYDTTTDILYYDDGTWNTI